MPDTDSYFRLTKYFHQILATATRTDIVRDPNGTVFPGAIHRIAFDLGSVDVETTIVLLTDIPILRFSLEAPDGSRIDPGIISSIGGHFGTGTNMSYFRFGLPLPVGSSMAHNGRWHVILELKSEDWKNYLSKSDVEPVARGVRYSVSTHAFSNLRFEATASQSDLRPGAQLLIQATISEYDSPFRGGASVVANIQTPNGISDSIELDSQGAGSFAAEFQAKRSGTYFITVRATGKSSRQQYFTREQLLTAGFFSSTNEPEKLDPISELTIDRLNPNLLAELLRGYRQP